MTDWTGKRSQGNPPMRVRHTPEQRELWHQAAEHDGRGYSDWVRDTLTAEARRILGLTPGGHAQVPTSGAPVGRDVGTMRPINCDHPGWKSGSSGLLVCKRCGRSKVAIEAGL